ncbi:cytochrome P450 [Exidia glandulosa HHB12029]|uniref:Cytochrome P450 n=1 Tax=Exidia glandulosa HHB12029 TaxID=1314781 RepID=A0A165FU72_EXIGL|nr:cytochrome P450 [Exidia glandulosa HHB12029]
MFAFSAILFLLCLFIAFYRGRHKLRLPPGPRRIPFIGNALDIPLNDAWLQFSRWRKRHGPLVYIEIMGQPTVIINTHGHAVDMMARRARLYAERPWNYVAAHLLLGGRFMPFMDFHARCRKLRRATEEGLRQSRLGRYRQIQQTEAMRATLGLLTSQMHWEHHLSTNTASLIMSVVYGLPPTDDTDPRVQAIKQFADRIARAIYPGAYLADTLPWLRHMPSWAAPWKRNSLAFYEKDSAFFHSLLRNAGASGVLKPILSVRELERLEVRRWHRNRESYLTQSSRYTEPSQTSAALCWFMLAMILNQGAQRKAQEELDSIVGQNRVPTFADIEKLPYLTAIIKEVLRWRPPLPLGIPHRTEEGDTYEGFDIPPGTVCIPNVWEINHDVEVWGEDADAFRPERHLDNGTVVRVFDGHDDNHMSFGLGKRICVGRHFAMDTMSIACATILWACDLQPPADEKGLPLLPPSYAHTKSGMTLHPAPFDIRIRARISNATEQLEVAQQYPDVGWTRD